MLRARLDAAATPSRSRTATRARRSGRAASARSRDELVEPDVQLRAPRRSARRARRGARRRRRSTTTPLRSGSTAGATRPRARPPPRLERRRFGMRDCADQDAIRPSPPPAASPTPRAGCARPRPSLGRSGRRDTARRIGSLPHTQTGKSGGHVQPRSPSRMNVLHDAVLERVEADHREAPARPQHRERGRAARARARRARR